MTHDERIVAHQQRGLIKYPRSGKLALRAERTFTPVLPHDVLGKPADIDALASRQSPIMVLAGNRPRMHVGPLPLSSHSGNQAAHTSSKDADRPYPRASYTRHRPSSAETRLAAASRWATEPPAATGRRVRRLMRRRGAPATAQCAPSSDRHAAWRSLAHISCSVRGRSRSSGMISPARFSGVAAAPAGSAGTLAARHSGNRCRADLTLCCNVSRAIPSAAASVCRPRLGNRDQGSRTRLVGQLALSHAHSPATANQWPRGYRAMWPIMAGRVGFAASTSIKNARDNAST